MVSSRLPKGGRSMCSWNPDFILVPFPLIDSRTISPPHLCAIAVNSGSPSPTLRVERVCRMDRLLFSSCFIHSFSIVLMSTISHLSLSSYIVSSIWFRICRYRILYKIQMCSDKSHNYLSCICLLYLYIFRFCAYHVSSSLIIIMGARPHAPKHLVASG